MKKITVENEGVKIKVDFSTVWAFMWRFYAIVFGIGFVCGFLAIMFGY